MNWDWSVVVEYKDLFIRGLITTIELTVVAVAVGLVIGILLGLMLISKKKWLKDSCQVLCPFVSWDAAFFTNFIFPFCRFAHIG